MALQTKTLYLHTGNSGDYRLDETTDDVTGAIVSFTLTFPAGQTITVFLQDNTLALSTTQAITVPGVVTLPAGTFFHTLPLPLHDARVTYRIAPAD